MKVLNFCTLHCCARERALTPTWPHRLRLNAARTQRHMLTATNSTGQTSQTANTNVFELMEADWASRHGTTYETVLIVIVLTLLAGIVINMLMVWGIHTMFPWLLLPWLIYYVPVIIIYFIAPVIGIYSANYIDLDDFEATRGAVFLALFPILFGLLNIYFWLVIYRLFEDLDKAFLAKLKPKPAAGGPITITVQGGAYPPPPPPSSYTPQPTVVKSPATPPPAKVVD